MSFAGRGRGRGRKTRSRPYQKKYVYQPNHSYYRYTNVRKTPYTFVGEVDYLIDLKYKVDSTPFNKKVYEVFNKLKKSGHNVEGFAYVFTSLGRQQLLN